MRKLSILLFVSLFILLAIFSYADNHKQRIIQKSKSLYLQLKDFKDKSDFHIMGFGVGGPYNNWMIKIEELEKDPNANLLMEEGVVVGDLKMLGLEYMKSKGKETEYTQFIVPEIERALKII